MSDILYENGSPVYAIVNGKLVEVQEVRHGRWETFSPFSKPRCSICGELCIGAHAFDYTLTNYCPNCGAKMDEVEK